ncbi:hypothetical protein [Pseudomonas asiatica]|uniref:hypothetical protein n=1 Tax=Pseudomonas asiatica TaxID=2219225 RepID=UPI0018D67692|nr:hypothetical protein [Pseudomonas asiatica]MBH3377132.1 hypothetical protein [Pseudomonas asiatica]
MPTENRSSNTDPRDVFIRLNPLGLGEAELRKDSTGFEDQRTHSDYLLFLAGYRETHAEPQHHPEPIAWMVGTAFWWTKEEAERDAAATGLPIVGLGPMAANTTIQQHQGQPVAVEGATFMGEPNFQHSIEWYREGISKHWKKICEQRVSIDALEKQLAEVQAMLRIYESFPGYLIDHCEGDTIYEESLQHWLAEHIKSLPASAEPSAPTEDDYLPEGIVEAAIHGQIISLPSAPVEIDERAEFEAHMLRDFPGVKLIRSLSREHYRNPSHEGAWRSWQARAALDRKPS